MPENQPQTLSDQLRAAIKAAPFSRFLLCERIGLDESSMSRFLNGRGGFSMSTLDKLGDLLCLNLAVDQSRLAQRRSRPTELNPINYRLRFVNNHFSELVEVPLEGITKANESAIRARLPAGSTLCHYRITVLCEPATSADRRHVQASTPDWVYRKFAIARPRQR